MPFDLVKNELIKGFAQVLILAGKIDFLSYSSPCR